MDDSSICADQHSGSATSRTTSPDRSWSPEDSDRSYTLDCEEPSVLFTKSPTRGGMPRRARSRSVEPTILTSYAIDSAQDGLSAHPRACHSRRRLQHEAVPNVGRKLEGLDDANRH